MKLFVSLSLVTTWLLGSIEGYRILCVLPYEGKSHFIMTGSLCKGLAKRGHQIDMISHFPTKTPIANYTDVVNLSGTRKSRVNNVTVAHMRSWDRNPIDTGHLLATEFGSDLCELMGEKVMQKFLKNPPSDHYDLVISEYFGSPCFLALGSYFNTQNVIITTFLEWFPIMDFMGQPYSLAFRAGTLYKHVIMNTFCDRLWNFLTTYLSLVSYSYYSSNHMDIARKYLSRDVPDRREVEEGVSLAFTSGHFSVLGVRPMIQGIIDVGGLHIEGDETKLTAKLKTWFDSAEHGVVYFTLGSMANVETLPVKSLLGLYASFAKISPIKVLMKCTNATKLPRGLPSNVITSPWIPQLPVLKHKNLKAFITHGGLMGLLEAVYCGVPIIGIPLFCEQEQNVNQLVTKNMGVSVNIDDITEQIMDAALDSVLNDPKYKESAKRLSRLFRDRPMSAMDTVAYWVEYVIRNEPISLKSSSANMSWWRLHLIDIYAFLIACFVLAIYSVFVLLRFLLRKLSTANAQRNKKLK